MWAEMVASCVDLGEEIDTTFLEQQIPNAETNADASQAEKRFSLLGRNSGAEPREEAVPNGVGHIYSVSSPGDHHVPFRNDPDVVVVDSPSRKGLQRR